MNDNLKNLYNTLVSSGYNPPAFDQFVKDMQDEKNLRGVYSTLQKEGYTPPSFDKFKSDMGFVAPSAKPKQTAVQPVVKQTTGQVQATPTQTAPAQPEQQEQQTWTPTPVQRMGMQMQLDETMRQVQQSQRDFNTRMENMRKGNTLGHTSEQKFNPTTGKFERKYYTTHGDEVSTPLEQSRLNLKYRDEWEATTEEGRKHRERRIQQGFEQRVGASLDKYDPDNAAAAVWKQAEERASADMNKYMEERSKFSFGNIMRELANTSNVTGGLGADNVETGIEAFATHLKYHDLQRMADDAWNMLGKEKQQSIIEDMYGALKNRYPQATDEQLQQAARDMAREQSDRRMYELAIAKNVPQDAVEYFIRKVAAGNSIGTLMQAAARAQAGTTGDWEAREVEEQQFGKDHKVAGVAGTVTGFALDPLTWASAGAGGAAVKGSTWLGGKMIGEAAMRKFSTTLGGRMLGSAIGGAVNFGTYEAGSEALDQMKWGGYIDSETGERKDGFSFGNVAGQFGHGFMMGAATGVIAPYLGNVSDKLVRASESTACKMAIRTGELGVGTLAEGTIFSVPEVISAYSDYNALINSLSDESSPNYIADEQERAQKIEELRNSRGDAMMDVWTDNMAMIAGFKAQHLLKSAPRRIYELASSRDPMTGRKTKAGFETRLRRSLDGTTPDLALTADEKAELERGGYSDLKDLTEEYSRFQEQRAEQEGQRPNTTDPRRMLEAGEDAAIPYNRFIELMNDGSISEAARAKMYYYLTGNVLPMSTVMASGVLENKDADGNVRSYTVQSYGANGVVTSRTFDSKERTDVEVNRIHRQVELNSVDVGERYFDWQGENRRMYEACQSVAEETGAPVNLLFELMKNKTEAMNDVELEWSKKIIAAYEGLGDKYSSAEVRTAIGDEFGVDVDKAIKKEPSRRSEQERKAVEEYGRRLFADVIRKQEEAAQRGETPNDPTDPNTPPPTSEQVAALLGIDDGKPSDGMSATFRRGYYADEQERKDIAMELAGEDPNSVNYAKLQEAWDGVMQRINEDAAYLAAQQREQGRQMQHSDGSIRTAILKEKDEDGHDKQVYVVEGNVQMMPDGSMVDPERSDNSVVIYDPATGDRKMIAPTADTGILSLGEVTSVEDYEVGIEQNRQRYIQELTDKAQGKVVLEPGQRVVMPNGEEAVVTGIFEDGGVIASTDDGRLLTASHDELQRISDEKALADYKQRHGITDEKPIFDDAAPTGNTKTVVVSGAPQEYTNGMELTVRDEDGTEKPAMVMGRVRYDGVRFVPDASGNIVEYMMDAEVKHDHIEKMNDIVVNHTEQNEIPVEASQYNLYDEVSLQTDNGTIHGTVIAEENGDGLITVQTEQPIGGRIVNLFSRERLDAMTGKQQTSATDEEKVIQQGIAGVGEGLRDAVNEQASGVRENDINNWLQKPAVAEAMRKYGDGAQSVEDVVQRALADNPTDDTRAALNDIMRFDSSKQLVQGYISHPQKAAPQTDAQPTADAMPMVGAGEDAEPDFMRTTPQRGHQYIYDEAGLSRDEANQFVANNIEAAAKALDKVKQKAPKMGTSLAKYNKDKAAWQQQIADAQSAVDYWNGVKKAQDQRIIKEREAQRERDAAAHDAAVAEAQAEYEARKQAESERKAVGNENPMPAITEKWNNANKIDGHRDEIVLPNGERVKGHYVLHESGASSPSHNPETWAKTDGFPMDANDNSVNDRDYEQDADAQQVTRDIARQYDQRALQTPVVVSQDGVVLSGNGRTMAGELAARDNTDGAYIDYLKEYAHKYGFTPEQVEAMQHPRVSFVPDEHMPYTAETFAKFNQQEMKSQNKTEHAVKLGKTVSDDTFKRIVRTINGFDTLGEFYADANASLGAVYDLRNAGVVPQAQLAEMVDGAVGHERLSAIGREMLENMLIGKAFAGSPEVVRMLTAVPSMRQSVITALGEISDNIALGNGYSLQNELADAVKLVFNARTGGNYQHGDKVSLYANQGVLFADPDQLQTVADFNNATMLMLADVLNDKRVTLLKTTVALYNNDARLSAAGVQDMFENGVRSRESILKDVINFINNNYGRSKEIEAARAAAVERRKAESVQQDGSVTESSGEGGLQGTSTQGVRKVHEGITETPLTDAEIDDLMSLMEDNASETPKIELNPQNWIEQFGENGMVSTPMGVVKMGENQIAKLFEKGRSNQFGMIKPTLETPHVVVEVPSTSSDGDTERDTSLLFIKTFKGMNGERIYYFKSVTVKKDGLEVSVSSHYDREKRVKDALKKGKLLYRFDGGAQTEHRPANVSVTASPEEMQGKKQEGSVIWRTPKDANTASVEQQGLDYAQPSETETATKGSGITPQSTPSESKGGEISETNQGKSEKVAENEQPNEVQAAVQAAEADVNTSPTEAQKEAGNYKKGHLKIDGFDVSIEQPKGSVRRGTDASGKQWEQTMNNTYGYIRGTEGVDGDHIDVFLSDVPSQGDVFVVDQVNKDGTFDEHKVMYGFADEESAKQAYLSNYKKGWTGLGAITHVSKDEFKKWVQSSHRKTKPFAEYKAVKQLSNTQFVEQPYTIEKTSYTNKKGKTTPMHLVTFGRALTKDEIRAGKELAKESRGWWDREKGGFMMRSEDAAKELAETLAKGDEETIADAQPLSARDMTDANDAAGLKSVDEAINVEQEKQTTPKYDYYREDNVYETTLSGLRETLANSNGGIPNVKAIEKQIRDLRKRANTIEDGMATAAGETIPQAFDALANLNGRRKAYEQFLVDIRKKMAETERDDALAAHGVKLGDKIMYKGKEVTIHDADARQVTLDVGLAPVMYEVTDWENVEVPKREPATTQPKKVNVESLMGELNKNGEAKLSDHTEEQQQEESTEQPKQEEKKAKSKWVNDEDADRFEELRRRLRQKLRGQLNMGVDPEVFSIGVEMSYLMLKKGARKFGEFAKNLIEALGDEVRPYIKAFYNGARDLPEMADYEKEMTPYEEVRSFDVMNFDKEGAKDIIATAEHVSREADAEREAQLATDKLKQQRNEQRKETEQEISANTEALASEAATVASEVESKLSSSRNEREVNDLGKRIDDAIDRVNDQLAVLGYYEAEPVAADFNEAYGYMRNAEKKAVKNVSQLCKTLADELGISDPAVIDAKGKKAKNVTSNIAPACGDVTMRITLNRDKGVELYMDFMLEPDGDNLKLRGIMYRPERNLPNGGRDYLRANNFFPADVTLPMMVAGIRSVCREWLPTEDYITMAERISKENARNQAENPTKEKKSKKKQVSLQEQTMPDLFSGLFGDEELNDNSNEQEVHVQSRPGTSKRESGHQRGQNEPLGEGKQHEDERTDEGGVVRRSGNNTKSDTERSTSVSEPSDGRKPVKPAPKEFAPISEGERKNTHNNHAERGTDYAPKSTSARIEANIAAIETMQRLIESGQPATPEDMAVLRKFSGWGGLGAAFKEKDGWNQNPVNKRLRELLSPDAYEAANMSRNSAYYTPASVIDAMWDVARAMGFRGGNVLEGSAGIGNILGLMPTDMSDRSNIHAVEIDDTTGNILSLLYPDANVEVKGFEKTHVANGSVDLAITNVPFVTGLRVIDETGDKDLSRKFHDIHDFCIAKNVRKLKEGGIGIFITSSGTLDSPNSAKLRAWLVNDGGTDVVGAFRMHNQTFGGTGATSDIIVIRKRVNGRKSANAIDVSGTLPIRTVQYNTGETKRGSSEVIIKDLALDVNKHFVEHPEDMAGEMAFAFEKGDTYRATSKALYPSPSINQEQRLAEWAKQFNDMDWDKAEERESQQMVYEDLGEDVKEGSMILDRDGNLCLAQRGKAVPIDVNSNKVKGHNKAECFTDYKSIKDALADVLEYQTTHSDDKGLKQRLDALNRAYDRFVKTYGHLNKNTSISFLRSDMDYPSIAALESVSETGDKSGKRVVTYGKTDIFSRRVVETESEPKPTTIKDGIIASIYLNGRVDVPYIAEQLGISESDVRHQIVESGLGFENPTTTEMEVSYEYMSGNVREKLRQAQENNTDGKYDANIKALERVVPMNIPAHLIEFTLGSSWVEPKLYEDYVKELTGLDVKLTNAGGTWIMNEPYWTDSEQNKAMGVISEKCDKTILGHELIKAAITCKSISVTKTVTTGYGSSKTTETIVDKEATMACANKIDEIRQDFKDWARGKMQGDPEMSERMERVYNELFNNSVPMEIPDEFVPKHFGGAATVVNGKPFQLRPHQAKAVIRGTTQPLMLAHEVGTGKTYTLISTAMEMRRLGTARKPMIVVQNATVGQFVASAKALYPNAKILTLEDADSNAEGRRNFYAKIRYNDWDMIVVPQSVFELIPDSEERQIRFIEDKVEEKMMVLEKMREAANDDRDPILRKAQRELDQLNDELNDLKVALSERKGNNSKDEKREAKTKQNAMVKAQEMLDRETDDVANFDDMGIDALLIDEAHEYKHLGFATAMQRGVKGVDPSYSKKSQGVYLKAQAVLESKNGKNVVFATGTPISNTAAEIWTFMRYLMPADTMREYGIYYFDDFVRNFGNIQQMLEFATNGKYKENNRFAGYVNLPELVRIWSGIADTVLTREAGGVSDKIPKMEDGKAKDIYLPQTKALRSVMKYVKEQLDEYERMSGKEKKENSHIPLTMYGIAQAAAVDPRLVLEDAADEPNSKTNEAVRQTLRSLEDTKEYNGTVAIFADRYQNNATGFNLYVDIRKKLIEAGVPEEQVVIVNPNWKVKKKLEIFDKVNRGEVRVIMGSTFTLGTGVNIQERLHTLIHVDAPNRPMDYTQRNGRILRQGNLHNEWGIPVRVLRFGVEDSLDVTAYQRLKTKGAIADSIMEGKKMMGNSMENRVLEEEQDLFGDITAQLSGSQYALLKNQVEKEVKKLEARRKQYEADQTYVHNQKPRLKALIKDAEQRAEHNKSALAKVEAAKMNGITIGKRTFPTLEAMADYIKDYNSKQREQQEQVRTASGYNAEAKSDLTINVGGFDFHVHRVIRKEQKQEKGQLSLSFFSKNQMTYSCPELGLEDIPVDGQRLKSALDDIVNNVMSGNDFRESVEYAERAAERYKGELQQVEARDGKPFEYADELKQAKEKLAEYEELMKAELEEKEAKYAEMDAEVEAASGVQLTDEESESDVTDTGSYRIVDDPELLNELEDGEWEEAYRVMQVIDGELYPPMAAVREGDLVSPIKLGLVEQAEEHPELIIFDDNGKPQYLLNKGQGKGSLKAAYNPYWHTSRTALNDQFTSAHIRPNLVVVRTLVPKSELTSGYRAQYAKDAVGEMSWHSGSVSGQLAELGRPRRVILSRYDKPMEIIPHAEVAMMIAEQLKDTDIAIPYNVVWPQLRDELEKLGVEISEEASGSVGEDPDFGKAEYVTDKMIAEMNEKAQLGMDKSPEAKRACVERLAKKFNTAINIIEDVNDITHPNEEAQTRRRKSKGWYDTATGEVNVVLPNNLNVEDAAATVFHETVGHKGLREIIGEAGYIEFLREVYEHVKSDVRRRIAKLASKNGWDFEKATDEYLSGLAEKGFEDFDKAERSVWQWLKEKVLKAIDKFLKSMKLPKWVKLGDNELRYMLWRSKERLERGKEHPIDVARDIVKREELGLTDEARYSMGDGTETFKERQRRAVQNKGTVMPGLNDVQLKVVDVPKHSYTGSIKEATRQAIEAAKAKYAPDGKPKTLHYDNFGATFDYSISGSAVEESLNPKQQAKSVNKGVHIAMSEYLDEIIGQSIEVEEHPDYLKNERGERNTSIINDKALMHRFYGAVVVDGVPYHVMTLMREEKTPVVGNGIHAYEVQKIEVLNDKTPSTSNGVGSHPQSEIGSSYPLAKLLTDIDKSYDTGKKLLEESKLADESTDLYRDGDFTPRDRFIARDEYERMVSSGSYQFQEAVQDSMLGLKRLYQAVLGKKTHIEDVAGFENAYLAENRMSSVNAAEQHEYYVRYMKPLLDAIGKIAGSNTAKRQELTDYLMAKHGLERNEVMAQRDFDAYQQQHPSGAKTLADFRERDYAGLTALTGEDDVAMAEQIAQQMVDDYERDHSTDVLWQRMNEATTATLAKIYSSGLLSKERYEQIQKMFEYYIPLQGWDETTSDEVYGYLTSKNGPLGGSPIKHARGRSSKADDPIATIAMMADDAIRQGNRNKMKQTFLNFVLNHQSDLVSVNDLWLQYNDVADEWEPIFADIEDGDTAADVERKVKAFEERMQQLEENDPDNYKRGRDAQNIPYKVVKGNLKEHQVLVRRNGRTYVLTINGNPRAAQALNGLTNPDVETGGVIGNMMQGAQWINRNLSAFYTTRNPDFVVSNFFRDMLYSNCMTWVKESPKYALRFHRNFGRVNPAHMRVLLGKWEHGTLDDGDYIEHLFKQFMLNGGETGYTNVKDIDGHKREIAAELKRSGSNVRKAWSWLGEQLDLLNGSAENCARFAAFITSRELGRTIERSIYDAKEISVNFNKKGSGGKMVNATGQTLFGKTGSYIGGGGRLLYVFWNAGVQGTTNFASSAKRHPVKATAGAAIMFMLGAVVPLLAQLMTGGDVDDDDMNAYYNLPEYVRRSNIVINTGNKWVAIPLPIEFRALYGLGELATGVITGNERYSDSELAFQMGSQVSQILPLDMLEGGGGINPFIPSAAKPFVEAYVLNKNWTGLPIYKDSPWNKNDPEWTKAYKSANKYLVTGAKWLNELSGGDDYKKGFIDINPAKVEYLLSGMFGGLFTTGDKLVKMGETAFSDREFDWRNMLIANRVVKTGDESTANRKLSNEYFKYKEEYEETKRLLKKYGDEAATNERYKHRLERLQNSEDYLLYDVFDNYQPLLKGLHEAKDGADEETMKRIEDEENTLRRDMVNLMHAIEDDKNPDINSHVDAMLQREFNAGGVTQKKAASRIAKRLGGTDSYGSPQNEYGNVYLQMRDYVDLAEDVTLQAALKQAKESGDTDRAKTIDHARRQITEVKKDLAEVPYTANDGAEVTAADIMQELRALRKQLMDELGIAPMQQPNR